MSGYLYGLSKKEADQRFNKLINEMELAEIIQKKYKILSGGQKRKCEIAAVLMHTPEILFLDEPTTGLDPATRKEIWKLIENLQRQHGMTVFLTTHYMEEAAKAENIVIIDQGEIIAQGKPFSLREKFSKDKLKLYYKPSERQKIIKRLEKIGIANTCGPEYIEIFLSSTLESIEIIKRVEEYLIGYEMIQGTMDDVFLQAVGKKLEG